MNARKSSLLRAALWAGCVLFSLVVQPALGGEAAKPDAEPKAEKSEKPEKTATPKKKKPSNFEKAVAACTGGEIPASSAKKNGLEARKGWSAARWGDLALCRQFKVGETKRKLLYLATGGGKKSKAAAILGTRLLLADEGAVKVQIYNRSPAAVKVAIAMWLGRRGTYFESPARAVAVGKWQELKFDLTARDYKSAASKWQYKAALGKDRRLSRVAVLLYHDGKLCRILIDGLTIDSKAPPKKTPPARKEEKQEPAKEKPAPEEKKPEAKDK
jgi:hypothetical protein